MGLGEAYDPDFYEHHALRYMARQLGVPVETNVVVTRRDSARSWLTGEVDGVARLTRGITGIEVKSFRLSQRDYAGIVEKYRAWPLDEVIIVAPGTLEAISTIPRYAVDVFRPEIANLSEVQAAAIRQAEYPDALLAELASGRHHFRYRSASRKQDGPMRTFVNQVSKSLTSPESVARDILRLSVPIQRVYWSKSRLLNPKDLYYRERPSYAWRGFRVLDIDGDQIHRPLFPCTLTAGTDSCDACGFFARRTAERLARVLQELRISYSAFDSGKKGFHLYVWDEVDPSSLLRRLAAEKIKVDRAVLGDDLGVIGFPGSVHADTGRVVRPCTFNA